MSKKAIVILKLLTKKYELETEIHQFIGLTTREQHITTYDKTIDASTV